MATRQILVERSSVISARSFDVVVASLVAAVGHPGMQGFTERIAAASTPAELEALIQSGIGTSGLMEFIRFDLGAVPGEERGPASLRILRFGIGNPLVMKEMVRHVPEAGSWAPVTILIDERPDGVHLSYDRMASFLAPHANEDALKVARELDAKVDKLLLDSAGLTAV